MRVSRFRQRLTQPLPMTEPMLLGWLSLAFTAGHFAAVTVEVRGRSVGWGFLAALLFAYGPPLFVRWVHDHSPQARRSRDQHMANDVKRRGLCILLLLAAVGGATPRSADAQTERYMAPDSAISALAGTVVRNADPCAVIWPGYWSAGKPFGFSRQADSSIHVYLPEHAPPRPYASIRGTHVPSELRGRLYVRRGYPDGFSGIDIHFRVGDSPMLPVVHAYTASPEAVVETLYHEGFHAHQLAHFTEVANARPAMGPTLSPVDLQGGTLAEYEALAEAERKALSAALVAPGVDSLRAVLRVYLSTRAQRTALVPEVQRVERWEEQNEGTAQYVGQLCAASAVGVGRDHARAHIGMRLSQPSPALLSGRPSKWRAYGVGAALALLLDDLGARDWQRAVTAGTALDALLLEQLYAPRPGSELLAR